MASISAVPTLRKLPRTIAFDTQPRQRLGTERKSRDRFAVSPTAVPPGQDGLARMQRLGKGAAPGHDWDCVQLACFRTDLGGLLKVNLGAVSMTVQGLPAAIQETEGN